MPQRLGVSRRRSLVLTGAVAMGAMAIALAGCGSSAKDASTVTVDRQAATYPTGSKLTVINDSTSPVQAKFHDGERHVPYTKVPPGGRRVGYGEDGGYDGGATRTSLSWDEDVVTRRLALVTSNTGKGLDVYAYDMTPNGDITKRTIRVAAPAKYDGDTSFEYDGHTIKVDRQGYEGAFYLWDIIIQR